MVGFNFVSVFLNPFPKWRSLKSIDIFKEE